MKPLAILLWFVACHDSPSKSEPAVTPPAAGASAKTPCEYMARGDAEAAVELKLPGTTEHAPETCQYSSPEFYGASLTFGDWESIKQAASTGHPKPVTGVGDEAVTIGAGTIYVRKGSRGFLLVINGPVVDHSTDQGLAKASALAVSIAAKM